MEPRICMICGESFTPQHKNQTNCPECRKHRRTSEYYSRAVEMNRRHAGDFKKVKIHNCVCRVCGKKFTSKHLQFYCSPTCLRQHVVDTATCPVCGVRLIDKGITKGKGCCSDECRAELRRRKNIPAEKKIPCVNCGKMFHPRNNKNLFCNIDCYHEYLKQRKKVKSEQTSPKYYLAPHKCPICGIEFAVNQYQKTKKYCSVACAKAAQTQAKQSHAKEIHSQYEGLSLCINCKTPQNKCERFTSQFMRLPKGAVKKVVNGKEIISLCPKYKANH